MADEVAPWFRTAVIEGMQMIQVLSLPGTPPEDTIGYTSDVWLRTLWSAAAWNEGLDRPRLSAAFVRLAREAERWPAPKHVLERLPPRAEARALPAPKLTREQITRNKARFAELTEWLRQPKYDAHVGAYRQWLENARVQSSE